MKLNAKHDQQGKSKAAANRFSTSRKNGAQPEKGTVIQRATSAGKATAAMDAKLHPAAKVAHTQPPATQAADVSTQLLQWLMSNKANIKDVREEGLKVVSAKEKRYMVKLTIKALIDGKPTDVFFNVHTYKAPRKPRLGHIWAKGFPDNQVDYNKGIGDHLLNLWKTKYPNSINIKIKDAKAAATAADSTAAAGSADAKKISEEQSPTAVTVPAASAAGHESAAK